MLDGRSAQLT